MIGRFENVDVFVVSHAMHKSYTIKNDIMSHFHGRVVLHKTISRQEMGIRLVEYVMVNKTNLRTDPDVYAGSRNMPSEFHASFFDETEVNLSWTKHHRDPRIEISFEDDWIATYIRGQEPGIGGVNEWMFFFRDEHGIYNEVMPEGCVACSPDEFEIKGDFSRSIQNNPHGALLFPDAVFIKPLWRPKIAWDRGTLWPYPVRGFHTLSKCARILGHINFMTWEDKRHPLTMLLQSKNPWKKFAQEIADRLEVISILTLQGDLIHAHKLINQLLSGTHDEPLRFILKAQQPYKGCGLNIMDQLLHIQKVIKE